MLWPVKGLFQGIIMQLCDAHRAPEQVDDEFGLTGSHTDVWGFGTSMLHLATGHLPYEGLSPMQMASAMSKRRMPEILNSLPDWLQQALKQCLNFNSAARPSVSRLLEVDAARSYPQAPF